MKVWKKLLLKVPKVGLAYRAFRWFRFTRKHHVIKNLKLARRLHKELKKLKESKVLDGKKTYISGAIAAVTMIFMWLNIGTPDDAAMLVESVTKVVTAVTGVVSVVGVFYGRYKAKP